MLTHRGARAMIAHALRGDEERCLAAGMGGHLVKPVRVEALVAGIARHSAAQFSHSICPECYDRVVRPELDQLRRESRKAP